MRNTALLLCGHGTVESLDDLPAFVTNIRRGSPPPPELIAELRHRYALIGGKSPLTETSRRLAQKLEAELHMPVRLAMRLWHPYPKDVLRELLASGIERVGVVSLAQFSSHVYVESVREAAKALEAEGAGHLDVFAGGNWGGEPSLTAAYAKRIDGVLAELDAATKKETAVLISAHSLPKAIVDAGDPYERDFRLSAAAVEHALAEPRHSVYVAFQSQGMSNGPGGRPMVWLGPDLPATIDAIAAAGAKRILFAPIGFLADHVEILFDLDIEAKQWAQAKGLQTVRMPSLNDHPDLVAVIAAVARGVLDG